jgi:hypothetical protein
MNAIDWVKVENWTSEIAQNTISGIIDEFVLRGAEPPTISWNPAVSEVVIHQIQLLYTYWRELRRDVDIPISTMINPLDLRGALGYLNILERTPGTKDFSYRLFGTKVAEMSGFDMTGKQLSQHPASPYVVEFALASSNACISRAEPLFTDRAPVGAQWTRRWPRLALPLSDEGGQVNRLIVATVPVRRVVKDAT